jgi:hypothetical protein
MEHNLIFFFIIGALGALTKDILKDNKLELPYKKDGNIYLGCLGGMIIGGITGYLIDNNLTTAFLSGYTGTAVIENLLLKKEEVKVPEKSIEEIIKYVAKNEGIDPSLALRVAKCENSRLDPKAVNVNSDGSKDRGIFQINEKWHPNVSKEEAFDPAFSTKYFCKRVKEGFLSDWDASRKCWDI